MANRITKKSSESSFVGQGEESPSSSTLTGSAHTSQAWQQRERRRKRLQKKSARAKKLRALCGVGIVVMALILAVVHVEIKMLMKANSSQSNAGLTSPGKLLGKVGRRIIEAHDYLEEKKEAVMKPHNQKATEKDNQIGFEQNNAKPPHNNQQQTPEKPKPADAKQQEINNLKKEIDSLQKKAEQTVNKEPPLPVEVGVEVMEDPTVIQSPELKEIVDHAKREAHGKPLVKTANFCGENVHSRPHDGKAHVPAIIVLGMEDTSTNLFWHVLKELTPGGLVAAPEGEVPRVRRNFEDLDSIDPEKIKTFFRHSSLYNTNYGKWVHESFCIQQQHAQEFGKPKILGFPWITTKNFDGEMKARAALMDARFMPPGTVRVIRYKRNLLDTITRFEHWKMQNKDKNAPRLVALAEENFLKELSDWEERQKSIDDFLVENQIPHMVLEHEQLFPFDTYREMLHLTKLPREEFLPLNVNFDYSSLPKEKQPPARTHLEKHWASLLGIMKFTKPLSLQDVFNAAIDYEEHDGVFWKQETVIQNYPKLREIVSGTPYTKALRKGMKQPDYGHRISEIADSESEKNGSEPTISPKLKEAVKKAKKKAEETPLLKTANFCSTTNATAEVTPAIVVLGMEAISTDLFWHILRELTPDGLVTPPQNMKTLTKRNYEQLNSVDAEGKEAFFEKLPELDAGKWVPESFCLQQEHHSVFGKPKVLGFPWITTDNFLGNKKATAALLEFKKLPHGSAKIIRYRRNLLDTITSYEHQLTKLRLLKLKQKDVPRSVTLQAENVLKQLKEWEANQKAIDDFLQESQIPHVVIQHEELFPYDTFRQMLHVTKLPRDKFIPLNLELDLSDVPKDEHPPQKTHMEQYWTYLLMVMKITKPFTLQDIFNAGIDFDQHDGVFWKQEAIIQNYNDIQEKLVGSAYESALRKETDGIQQQQVKTIEEVADTKNDSPVIADQQEGHENLPAPIDEKKEAESEKQAPADPNDSRAPPENHQDPPTEDDKKGQLESNPEEGKPVSPKDGTSEEIAKPGNNDASDPEETRKEATDQEGKENEPPKQVLPKAEEKVESSMKDGESDKLHEVVARALEKAEEKDVAKTGNFCGIPQASGEAMPAVIILGMEDTSTDLFWHVLKEITPEGLVSKPEGLQPPSKHDYEDLNNMDPTKPERFFRRLPKTNHGKWVHESFCLQQQHAAVFGKPKVLGFPWLTAGNLIANTEAIEALEDLKKMPKGSVTVIRYRRNVLDMVSRHEQYLLEVKENQAPESVTLDPKMLLKRLTHWTSNQKEVDSFLETHQIPHVIVDHEKLFPFNAWKDLVNVTGIASDFPVPLNVDIDYSLVPPDERPPERSELEQEWANVLNLMKITKPTSLFGIFSAAKEYERKDKVFWRQQMSIKNYPKVQQVLTGTHYQSLLRNLEYKHDYYGCACNDKEANKKRMWKGWKKAAKTDTQ